MVLLLRKESMTIEYRKGNLLNVTEGIIMHGCNAQGVMGAGVAKAITDKYPQCYVNYLHSKDEYRLGKVIWYFHDYGGSLLIANVITQQYCGRDNKRYVNYTALATGFSKVFDFNEGKKHPVYFPKIGAGLGGGDWNIIEQLINDADPYDKVKKVCYEL